MGVRGALTINFSDCMKTPGVAFVGSAIVLQKPTSEAKKTKAKIDSFQKCLETMPKGVP